jgi:parallel beta-helix repeat protein
MLTAGGYNSYIDNYIYRNAWGIELLTGHSATISNNDVIESWYDGIQIHESYGNTITYNSVVGNGWKIYRYGIHIWDYSFDNIISYNYVADTKNIGIYSFSSRSNTYIGNTIENNRIGLYINGNDIAIVSQNNFIDNRQKQTDIIVPMFKLVCRGNYWSDYRGHGPYFFQGHIIGLFDIFVWLWIFVDWYPASEPIEGYI